MATAATTRAASSAGARAGASGTTAAATGAAPRWSTLRSVSDSGLQTGAPLPPKSPIQRNRGSDEEEEDDDDAGGGEGNAASTSKTTTTTTATTTQMAPAQQHQQQQPQQAFLVRRASRLSLRRTKLVLQVQGEGEVLIQRGGAGSVAASNPTSAATATPAPSTSKPTKPKKSKTKLVSVRASDDVSLKNKKVTIGREKVLAKSKEEAAQIVHAIQNALTQGYGTCEDEDEDEDENGEADDERESASSPQSPAMDWHTTISRFATLPATLSPRQWTQPGTSEVRIRANDYLSTKRKIQAQPQPLFEFVALDLFHTAQRLDHLAEHPLNRVRLAHERGDPIPFTWIINFQVPAGNGEYNHFVMYFAARDPRVVELLRTRDVAQAEAVAAAAAAQMHGQDQGESSASSAFGPGFLKLLLDFFTGDDDELRRLTFKLIPRIVEGPFVLRQLAPSNKPCLLATKITMRSYRTPHSLELDFDTSVDRLGDALTVIATRQSKIVVCDLFFLLESKTEEQLPEFLAGAVRARNVDFGGIVELPMP